MTGEKSGTDRVKGDQMGMLATVINGLAIQSTLENTGQKTIVFTSINIESVGERFNKEKVMAALATVDDPELHKDLVSLGFIENLKFIGYNLDLAGFQ